MALPSLAHLGVCRNGRPSARTRNYNGCYSSEEGIEVSHSLLTLADVPTFELCIDYERPQETRDITLLLNALMVVFCIPWYKASGIFSVG